MMKLSILLYIAINHLEESLIFYVILHKRFICADIYVYLKQLVIQKIQQVFGNTSFKK